MIPVIVSGGARARLRAPSCEAHARQFLRFEDGYGRG